MAVNGEELEPVDCSRSSIHLGGRHGVGRVDIVENRFLGMKSRGVYETPGCTLLLHAHRAVESITLDREVQHLRDELMPRFAEIVYNGLWFSPEREALQSFMDSVQERVNGEARLKLYKGHVGVEGRRSLTHTLYDEKIATFEADDVYDQSDATGFIRLRACACGPWAPSGSRRASERASQSLHQSFHRPPTSSPSISGSISRSSRATAPGCCTARRPRADRFLWRPRRGGAGLPASRMLEVLWLARRSELHFQTNLVEVEVRRQACRDSGDASPRRGSTGSSW